VVAPGAVEPATIDPLGLAGSASQRGVGSRTALVAGGRELSYAEMAERVCAASARLLEVGVTRGRLVALRAISSPETFIAVLACIELGAPLLPLHPRFTSAEVSELLAIAPAMLLSDEQVVEVARAPARAAAPATTALDPREALALVPTSGTTGRPKLAVLSRAAFVASAAASAINLGWRADDRWLCCLPLAHVGGLSILTRCAIARRAVILEPRFDAQAVLDAIAAHRATLLSVVPTQLRALLDADDRGVLRGVRAVLVGGAACPITWLSESAERGVAALTTYGLTEGCSQVTAQRPAEPGAPPPAEAGCGAPLFGVQLCIASDDGAALPAGQHGRILMRGRTRMQGYFGAPPLADGEWLDTGDVGFRDERGTLFVEARRTDLVVTGGENVYPAEVERSVEACTGVKHALVFGVADDRWGQLVAVLLEVDADRFAEQRFALEIVERLASHKRPRRFAVVERLPVTAAGKPDRGAAARLGGALRPMPRGRIG
jgi:O-succinylbenzoic acid--CoA ligase